MFLNCMYMNNKTDKNIRTHAIVEEGTEKKDEKK